MVRRAYRFRAYPTPEQEPLIRDTLGCVRWVWNQVLAEQRMRGAGARSPMSYYEASAYLTALKREPTFSWLNRVSSVPLQQALRHQAKAYSDWAGGRAGQPAFKRKHDRYGAAEFTRSAFRWEPRCCRLTLAKIGALHVRWSRRLPRGCEPSTVTLTRDAAGRTFVSIWVDEPITSLHRVTQVTGLDLGLSAWIATAQGEKVVNPRPYAQHEHQLARAQQGLSRTMAGSKNRAKATRRVPRLHARIADARRDALHKLTTRIVFENQAIAVERLHVRGMVQNRHLAKAITDAGWGELVRQISYKARWYGRQVVVAPRLFPSSKRCSACGRHRDRLPLHVRTWTCDCGQTHDRDVNAARNLLTLLATEASVGPAVGHTVAACGGMVRPTLASAGSGTAR